MNSIDVTALTAGASGLALGSAIVLALMGGMAAAVFARNKNASLFNRLFIVVAATSAFFSAVSSAIGFSLITSQETTDFFRNAILPPAFGVFVFFLGLAIWIGGADLVRRPDWFRGLNDGPGTALLRFLERAVKIFVIIPILSLILFVVSTWTTVVGIAGVDAVRFTYGAELQRLQNECSAIVAWRQRDRAVLEDLKLSVRTTAEAARRERDGGFQTGAAGRGAVAAFIEGVAEWYAAVEESVAATLAAEDPSGLSPFTPEICAAKAEELRALLAANAYDNYDRWASTFERSFNDFAIVLSGWRQDRRIQAVLKAQLDAFGRANPKPVSGLTAAQSRAINQYQSEVIGALTKFHQSQKNSHPPIRALSEAEKSPERGLEIITAMFSAAPAAEPQKRTKANDAAKPLAPLSELTPRDAVLKHAQIFSDVWLLGIAWDYASFVLMLAFLFFPSAERGATGRGRA